MAKRRMPPLTIIKDLDVLENINGCFRPCLIVLSIESFPFERGEETFGHRIVVTISRPTHTARDALAPQQVLEIIAGILTAPIRVVNEARTRSPSAYGHCEWSIPEIVDTSDTHDNVQGGVLVNAISQFLHLVKAKIEKTLWEKLYVRFGSLAVNPKSIVKCAGFYNSRRLELDRNILGLNRSLRQKNLSAFQHENLALFS